MVPVTIARRARPSSARSGSSRRAMAFWTVETQEFANAFTYGGNLITQYPLDVFGRLAPAPPRLRHPARVRGLLARALDARQARCRSGCPSWLRSASPVRRRDRRARRRGRCGAPPSATTGARGADRMAADRARPTSPRTSRSTARAGKVRRERRNVHAVDGISLADRRGRDASATSGPNGAGKSTTIKMLTGILVPTSGEVRVAGPRPAAPTGSSSPGGSAWCSGSARSSGGTCRCATRSSCCATSTGCRRRATPRTSLEFVELLDLGPFLDTPVRQLSLGQRMRGELDGRAAARPGGALPRRADHRPRRGEQGTRPRVPRRPRTASSGTTCCSRPTTSTTSSGCASRLVVIDHGRVIYDGTRRRAEGPLRHRPHARRRPRRAGAAAATIAHAEVVRVDGPRQWLRFHRDRVTAAELVAAVARSGNLRDLTIEEPDIEDVVTRIYTRSRAAFPAASRHDHSTRTTGS